MVRVSGPCLKGPYGGRQRNSTPSGPKGTGRTSQRPPFLPFLPLPPLPPPFDLRGLRLA
jgi:hypothetical protein